MRVLTVRQPWAWAIIHGGKDVENRVRNVAGDYRGQVAIHAGLNDDSLQQLFDLTGFVPDGSALVRGAIIGVVDLVDVHDPLDHRPRIKDFLVTQVTSCSPWADPTAYHLVLENPRALECPIPFTGALGLRRLDDATVALINQEVSA